MSCCSWYISLPHFCIRYSRVGYYYCDISGDIDVDVVNKTKFALCLVPYASNTHLSRSGVYRITSHGIALCCVVLLALSSSSSLSLSLKSAIGSVVEQTRPACQPVATSLTQPHTFSTQANAASVVVAFKFEIFCEKVSKVYKLAGKKCFKCRKYCLNNMKYKILSKKFY